MSFRMQQLSYMTNQPIPRHLVASLSPLNRQPEPARPSEPVRPDGSSRTQTPSRQPLPNRSQ